MSKMKALITTLVLGTSSVAMADSSISFHANASWGTPMSAPVVRDHRPATVSYQQPARVRGTWVALTEPMTLSRGRGFIDLSSRTPLNQIRLQSASGQAFISTITVQYTNGASQVVTLNQWIDSRNPLAQFNLNRTAQVDSILINGSHGMRSGKFQVFGYATSRRPEQPPVYQPPVYQPPVYQPPVYQPPVYQPATPLSVPLANNVTLWGTHGSKEILVDRAQRSFTTLRITGTTGSSPMSHIIVAFTNGHQQTIPINRTQVPGENLDLTLDGAGRYNIERITVYHNGSAQLVGPTGYFNVTAL
jgi:hypothetical protein